MCEGFFLQEFMKSLINSCVYPNMRYEKAFVPEERGVLNCNTLFAIENMY